MKIKTNIISVAIMTLAFFLLGGQCFATSNVPDDPTRIYIINIGYLNRGNLAEKINIIQKFEPKVIGIDAVFVKLKDKDGDKKLKAALNAKSNIVLGCFAKFDEGKAFGTIVSDSYFGKLPYGFCSLIISDQNEAEGIDKFIQTPNEEGGKDEVYPLAAEMIRIIDPEAFKYFDDHVQSTYDFKYSEEDAIKNNTLIEEVDFEDINSKADLSKLTGNIVLLGYLKADENSQNDDIDTFLSTDTNGGLVKGVKIHAYVIGKILNEFKAYKKN